MRHARSIVVRPDPGISPEQARDVRARAWKFVFDCHRNKAAGTSGGEDAAKEIENGCDAKTSISR